MNEILEDLRAMLAGLPAAIVDSLKSMDQRDEAAGAALDDMTFGDLGADFRNLFGGAEAEEEKQTPFVPADAGMEPAGQSYPEALPFYPEALLPGTPTPYDETPETAGEAHARLFDDSDSDENANKTEALPAEADMANGPEAPPAVADEVPEGAAGHHAQVDQSNDLLAVASLADLLGAQFQGGGKDAALEPEAEAAEEMEQGADQGGADSTQVLLERIADAIDELVEQGKAAPSGQESPAPGEAVKNKQPQSDWAGWQQLTGAGRGRSRNAPSVRDRKPLRPRLED
jgi:hypothetical protein